MTSCVICGCMPEEQGPAPQGIHDYFAVRVGTTCEATAEGSRDTSPALGYRLTLSRKAIGMRCGVARQGNHSSRQQQSHFMLSDQTSQVCLVTLPCCALSCRTCDVIASLVTTFWCRPAEHDLDKIRLGHSHTASDAICCGRFV